MINTKIKNLRKYSSFYQISSPSPRKKRYFLHSPTGSSCPPIFTWNTPVLPILIIPQSPTPGSLPSYGKYPDTLSSHPQLSPHLELECTTHARNRTCFDHVAIFVPFKITFFCILVFLFYFKVNEGLKKREKRIQRILKVNKNCF